MTAPKKRGYSRFIGAYTLLNFRIAYLSVNFPDKQKRDCRKTCSPVFLFSAVSIQFDDLLLFNGLKKCLNEFH